MRLLRFARNGLKEFNKQKRYNVKPARTPKLN